MVVDLEIPSRDVLAKTKRVTDIYQEEYDKGEGQGLRKQTK